MDLKKTGITPDASSILSADERERAARLVDPIKRDRFLSVRMAMRNILSGYTHVSPENIQLSHVENGKPFMENNAQIPSIYFNITHSADLMLMAVSDNSQIWVDVEKIQPMTARDRTILQ